ncbi:MAG: glycosyltransferase family 2 protein [Clostridia bacterium]|nr:glycosyltransferase family 2 protein [Clostridia bacterium]
MKAIIVLNCIISIVFTLCYAYQFFYVFVGLLKKPKTFVAEKQHRFAVVVSARNESNVIGNLIKSIRNQKYPKELVDIFVIADNCTDNTAEVARNAGAIVYERFNKELVGKGYALDWLFKIIQTDHADKNYEAYIIFDADNVLDPNYIAEMNKVFDNGYSIITSYRNSKNFDGNWISAGYSLWFLREAKFLNNARMHLGTSCAVSGTGFLVGSNIIAKNGGWIHHLLTEDIEFTTDSIIKGEKIGYCENAVLYDEQPTLFSQSYTQRLRWAKGFYQVFKNYSVKLVKGIFKGNFGCFDMLMTLSPAMLLTLMSVIINIVAIPVGIITNSPHLMDLVSTLAQTLLNFYGMFFFLGTITAITEWKQIHASAKKKVLYLFTFPLFMLTYVPISIVALFRKIEWKPITHSVSKSLDEICGEEMPIQ